jgi:uroporphyrinogen decarboxylase
MERMLKAADAVLERAAGRPGHIFNLGHGILPPTSVEHVQTLARYVKEHRIR